MTNIIKLKFLRSGKPYGREYTYYTPVECAIDDLVQLNQDGELSRGIVTQIDVPESEIAPFKDRAKFIYGRLPASLQKY